MNNEPRALVDIDGEIVPAQEAKVSVWDRGFLFGDAIFETLRFSRGKPVLWNLHFERLKTSASGVGLTTMPEENQILARVNRLIEMSGFSDGTVYVQVTRGNVFRRSDTLMPERPTVVIAVDGHTCLPEDLYERGVSVITFEDIRWKFSHLKTTNLLPRTIARLEAQRKGAHEALFVGADGKVFEGTSTNVFIYRDGTLSTPALSERLLAGTTRAVLIVLGRRLGLVVRECDVTVKDLLEAEEVMLCGTTTEVLAVVRVDGHEVGTGAVGPIARRLRHLYRSEILEA